MTASTVLAEARLQGLILVAVGAALRVRGPKEALTPTLRKRIEAVKPELLALLTATEPRRSAVANAWAAAYRRLAAFQGGDWPAAGFEVLGRHRPALMLEFDEAERAANASSVRHCAEPSGDAEEFVQAIARWEAVALRATAFLASVCHDCGQAAAVVVVDPTDGSRFCRACVRPGGRR